MIYNAIDRAAWALEHPYKLEIYLVAFQAILDSNWQGWEDEERELLVEALENPVLREQGAILLQSVAQPILRALVSGLTSQRLRELGLLDLAAEADAGRLQWQVDELLPADLCLIRTLESIGKTGQVLADEQRANAEIRAEEMRTALGKNSDISIKDIEPIRLSLSPIGAVQPTTLEMWGPAPNAKPTLPVYGNNPPDNLDAEMLSYTIDPDGRLVFTSPVPGLPTTYQWYIPDPMTARAWRLVALAVWRDLWRTEVDFARRHPAPALGAGILYGTLRKFSRSAPIKEGGNLYLQGDGQRELVAAAVDPDLVPVLFRGLEELGGVLGDRLIRAAVRGAWEQRTLPDGRVLRFEGGRRALRERLGVNAKFDPLLHDALRAGARFEFQRGSLEVVGLWAYMELAEAPGQRALAEWTIGTLLAPGAPWRRLPDGERRPIPVLATPDLRGFNSRHIAPLLRFQWELLSEASERLTSMKSGDWIPFGTEAKERARERAEVPKQPATEVLERWSGEGGWFEDNGSAIRLVDPDARRLWRETSEGATALVKKRAARDRRKK